MTNAVNTLATTVSSDALWGVFNTAVPYIAVVVLAGFGFYLVRKMIKGVSKGRANIQFMGCSTPLIFLQEVIIC